MEMVYPITSKEKLDDMAKYLKNKNYRDYMIFVIGINLGLRISDFTDTNVAFYRQICENGFVEMMPAKTIRYHKRIRIPLQDDLKILIEEFIKDRNDDEPMFLSRKQGYGLTRQHINRILKEAAIATGIKDNIGCHSLRKTFGYWHYKNNNDIRTLMEIFNHTEEKVTLKYIGVTYEEIEKSMQCMNLGIFIE